MNILELLDMDSGNASVSFNKMKQTSSNTDVAVTKEYLQSKDLRNTRRRGKSNLQITDNPFIEIGLQEKRKIVYSVFKSIRTSKYPYLFITVKYSIFDDKKDKWLDRKDAARRWDRYEVEKTNILCRNMMRECFDVSNWYAFLERHEPRLMPDGTLIQGRYHTHIIIPHISDYTVESPNRKCRRIMREYAEWIEYASPSTEVLKKKLIKSCLLKADWIKRWKNQIDIQEIYTERDLANVVCYCLKTYTNIKSPLDFNEVICNSSTYAKDLRS